MKSVLQRSTTDTSNLKPHETIRTIDISTYAKDTLREAILKAHRIGRGEIGRNGSEKASVYNYTFAQIREKIRILNNTLLQCNERKTLLTTPKQRSDLIHALITKGICGDLPEGVEFSGESENNNNILESMLAPLSSDNFYRNNIKRILDGYHQIGSQDISKLPKYIKGREDGSFYILSENIQFDYTNNKLTKVDINQESNPKHIRVEFSENGAIKSITFSLNGKKTITHFTEEENAL
jgi:hypothetical protein